MIVVDSSAFVDTVADPDGRGGKVLECLERFDGWWAPECFDAEVAQGLRHQMLRGTVSASGFAQEMRALSRLALGRIPVSPLLGRMTALAHSLSSYDAAFVAVAELLDAPLLTTDARLARAPGPQCEFLLVKAN